MDNNKGIIVDGHNLNNNNLISKDIQHNKLEYIRERMIQGNEDTIKQYTVNYEKEEISAVFKNDTHIVNKKVNIVGDGVKMEQYQFPRNMKKDQMDKNREILRSQGETQERVAEILETNQTLISNMENNKS